jgi:hypothetical protein
MLPVILYLLQKVALVVMHSKKLVKNPKYNRMKTKTIKTLHLKKRAVAELNKQTSEGVKGGYTTLVTLFCNSFVAGEDYRVCFAEQ